MVKARTHESHVHPGLARPQGLLKLMAAAGELRLCPAPGPLSFLPQSPSGPLLPPVHCACATGVRIQGSTWL